MSDVNPFLFLQSYTIDRKFALKGRESETEKLLALLQWKDIIVIFGKSGVGKTSFINYALSDKIKKVNWLPINITRKLEVNDSFKSALNNYITNESAIKSFKNTSGYQKVESPHITLSSAYSDIYTDSSSKNEEALKRIAQRGNRIKKIYGESNLLNESDKLLVSNKESLIEEVVSKVHEVYRVQLGPVFLIFDQLEELFILGSHSEKETFLLTIKKLLTEKDLPKKIILVLREEHLSYVQEIERIINGVFQDALPILKIKQLYADEIYEALLQPEREVNEMISFREILFPIKYLLLEKCSSEGNFDAQMLQVLLYILWERLIKNKQTQNEPAEKIIESILQSKNCLKDYVSQVVNIQLGDNSKLLQAPHWLVLRKSISHADTKWPLSLSSLIKEFDLPNILVEEKEVISWCENLVKANLLEGLSLDDSKDNERFYQLKHDVLVDVIKELDTHLELRFPRRHIKVTKNPYQGLKQYEFIDKGKFYGRDEIIKEYKEFLLQENISCLVVVGDSGTGKSSMVKAGLLPEMEKEGYRALIFKPEHPLADFEKKIKKALLYQENHGQVCLYIDQFEECYTYLKFDELNTKYDSFHLKEVFDNFLKFIEQLVFEKNGNFKLIVSIRHEYAHEFDRKIDTWRKFKKLLRYPNQNEIFNIIVGPAHESGIDFTPKNLPEIITMDALNTSFFLPLLSFTLNKLYIDQVITRKKDFFTLQSYLDIGGVVGCLQRAFSSVYNNLSHDNQILFRLIMPRMIVMKDAIPKASRLYISLINFSDSEKNEQAKHILEQFVEVGILQNGYEKNGKRSRQYCEPIHDSLLTYCDEIRDLINSEEGRQQIELQLKLEIAIQRWKTSNIENRESLLWHKHEKLNHLFELLEYPNNNWLFLDEEIFIRLSKNYDQELEKPEDYIKLRKQKLKNKFYSAILGIVILLAIIGFAVSLEWRNKSKNETKAKEEALTAGENLKKQGIIKDSLYQELDKKIKELKGINKKLYSDSIAKEMLISNNKSTIEKLEIIKRELIVKNSALIDSIISIDRLNKELTTKNGIITEQNKKIIDLIERTNAIEKISKLDALAYENLIVSPALSYNLASQAFKINPQDSTARAIIDTLRKHKQYFETLIVDNVEFDKVSRDGKKVITVERDKKSGNLSLIRLWDRSGLMEDSISTTNEFETLDISIHNDRLLVVEGGRLRLIDKTEQKQRWQIETDLRYARFAESDNRFFAISDTKLYIYSESNLAPKTILFQNNGNIINAKLSGNALVIQTSEGVYFANVSKSKKILFKPFPQSFFLNNLNVISMMKPAFGSKRYIIMFDSLGQKIWSAPVPNSEFRIINHFSSSINNRFGILQFNSTRSNAKQITQIQQQQQQTIQKKQNSIDSKSVKQDVNKNVFLVDLEKGHFDPLILQRNALYFSASQDTVIDFNYGSIGFFGKINTDANKVAEISEKTRFVKVLPLGINNEFILSRDINGQLKVWYYCKLGDFDNTKQIKQFTEGDIEKILSTK